MVKIIMLLSLLCVSCTVAPNMQQVFLDKIAGSWKTSSRAEEWFKTIGEPEVVVPKGTVVNVDKMGHFTIKNVPFRFISVDTNGVFVAYGFIYPPNSTERYFALGLNEFGDILFNTEIVSSADQIPTDSEQGDIFLEK